MIVFDLECSQGHLFEGWFDGLEAFEDQSARGLVSCPYCEDTRVKKVLSPVALKKSAPARETPQARIDYKRLAKEVLEYIQQNFEDVGTNFTSEALKIHYGVAEKRNIKGAATKDEEEILREEGIEYLKIPVLETDPKKKN